MESVGEDPRGCGSDSSADVVTLYVMTSTERTSTHPGWCCPSRCHDTGVDVVHAEAPEVIVGLDGPLSLALVRCDDHDDTGPPEARLTVGDGIVHLDHAAVRALRAWAVAADGRMTP